VRAQFGAALMLLTRVPAGWLIRARAFPEARDCLWAYPLVGALVGAVGAGAMALLPPALGAVWALVAMAALTGALHEDGLADMADGFGGGATPAGKLEIMRDSRVGSYGVVAVVLSMAVRGAALAGLAGAGWGGWALVAAGALSRASMAVPLLLLRPARVDGLGAALGRMPAGSALACGGLAAAVALVAVGPGPALVAIAAALVAAGGVSALARRQIGGFTGDVLGGCAVVTEAAILSVLAAS